MKIKDILQQEQANTNSIFLHKEGIFWRAYEKSAYLFSLYIKAYQITKKYYKNVGSEVVYLGFPDSSLNNILKITDKHTVERQKPNIKNLPTPKN